MFYLTATTLRLLVQLALVLLVISCSTTRHYSYTPILEKKSDSSRLISLEEKNAIELSNGNFKMLVYTFGYWRQKIIMNLIVPTGDEIFIQDPFIELKNVANQTVLARHQTTWALYKGAHIHYKDTRDLPEEEANKYRDLILDTNPIMDPDFNKLIGLEEFPPATFYSASTFYLAPNSPTDGSPTEFSLKLPVFRTPKNEIIRFEDVFFNTVTTTTTTMSKINWVRGSFGINGTLKY